MSMPACRYIGSLSSWYSMPPATAPPTSITSSTASAASPAASSFAPVSSAGSGSPHQRRTDGSARTSRNAGTSSARPGRTVASPPTSRGRTISDVLMRPVSNDQPRHPPTTSGTGRHHQRSRIREPVNPRPRLRPCAAAPAEPGPTALPVCPPAGVGAATGVDEADVAPVGCRALISAAVAGFPLNEPASWGWSSGVVPGELVPHGILLDLPGRGLRQVVDHQDGLGCPIRVDDALDRVDQLPLVDPRAGPGHDDRGDRLAPAIVRQADHDHLGDVGIRGVHRLLDLDRGHILAAGLDHVLAPVAEPRMPSASKWPTSPEWNQPCANAASVAAGLCRYSVMVCGPR